MGEGVARTYWHPGPYWVYNRGCAPGSGAPGVDQLTDEQLITRMMDGDTAALARLVERYHRPLLGYLYRLTSGNDALAEDLAQETFVRILQQDSYQSDRPFKPWLY